MFRRKSLFSSTLVLFILLSYELAQPQAASNYLKESGVPVKVEPALSSPVHFAVIGDYGLSGAAEQSVATLVKSWNPDFILTTGDNNYPSGSAATIDPNIGQYYSKFISPYSGSYGAGAATNNFFPSAGNHDWDSNLIPYQAYFALPGNERYYDFVKGPVHFFVLDSDSREPDGITPTSRQATWLQARLATSTSPWRLVYMHHPPYSSSGVHGSTPSLQWPYQQWGISAVLSGHDHTYERIMKNGLPYFVNGLGGNSSIYPFGTPVAGSVVRYNSDYGAMLVDATDSAITFQFINRNNAGIDTFTLNNPQTYLTVNNNIDDGSGQPGMLSTVINAAQPGQVIKFNLSGGNIIQLTQPFQMPAIRAGVKIEGNCNNGPQIIIDGQGYAGDGLVLSGASYIYGIKVTNFDGRQIKTNGPGNLLFCVEAAR